MPGTIMDLFEAIYQRRSVRTFTDRPVAVELLHDIIRAGTWAPSGLNNQPWRFVTVCDPILRESLARLTKYGHVIRMAPALIVVFSDQASQYHATKDHQAIGACLQNMLLAAHGLGLGAVWLGEILKNAEPVRVLLDVPAGMDLMAVLAIGHQVRRRRTSARKPLDEVILNEL